MIIRVLDMGKDAAGLTRYLFGPGKANEHTNQRLVAGSTELHAEWGGGPLTMAEATHLGRMVEMAWRRQYVPELAVAGHGSMGGISRENLTDTPDSLPGQAHVFHAAISLPNDEEPLTDAQWRQVAEEYLRGMGYIDADGYDDPAWVAVHHGVSTQGNDHIHLVVCTTRRDGTQLDTHSTGLRSQQVRRDRLEKLTFVTPLHDHHATNKPTLKGYTAAEHNIARERAKNGTGPATPDRVLLQRIVRAAAAQAHTEADFINAVVSHPGVSIEPARWTPGTRERVTGYRVQIGTGPTFTASQLASDLTLAKLRPTWTETPETLDRADALWRGDTSQLDPLTATRDIGRQLDQAAAQLQAYNDQLTRTDLSDDTAWSTALNDTARLTTILATGRGQSSSADGRPTGFAADAGPAADALTRQALVARTRAPDVRPGLRTGEVAARHVQLALRAGGTNRHRGWLAVLQQLNRTINALSVAAEARDELRAAHALQHRAAPALARLHVHMQQSTDQATLATRPRASEQLLADRLGRNKTDQQRPGRRR